MLYVEKGLKSSCLKTSFWRRKCNIRKIRSRILTQRVIDCSFGIFPDFYNCSVISRHFLVHLSWHQPVSSNANPKPWVPRWAASTTSFKVFWYKEKHALTIWVVSLYSTMFLTLSHASAADDFWKHRVKSRNCSERAISSFDTMFSTLFSKYTNIYRASVFSWMFPKSSAAD